MWSGNVTKTGCTSSEGVGPQRVLTGGSNGNSERGTRGGGRWEWKGERQAVQKGTPGRDREVMHVRWKTNNMQLSSGLARGCVRYPDIYCDTNPNLRTQAANVGAAGAHKVPATIARAEAGSPMSMTTTDGSIIGHHGRKNSLITLHHLLMESYSNRVPLVECTVLF